MSGRAHDEQVEARLNKGLLDYWYPVLPSWAVRDTPIGITRLSQDIALWRDADGTIRAIEDRCPHRGARLSLGWNLGDRVACWYHGVQVNGAGVVADVPAVTQCAMKGQKRVRSYPAEEHAGAIFLWFGADAEAPPKPLLVPEDLRSPHVGHMLCTAHWQCNYRYAIDNVMDPMHGAYLHGVSHSMAEGEKAAEMELRLTQTGLYFGKVGQMGVNFDWTEFGESGNCLWLTLAIPYQKKFGPGGPFGIVGLVTPVDEENCRVFFWRTRRVEGWQRNIWRFLYRNRLEGLHWDVLEQDRLILENMAPAARDREFLYQHDVGLGRLRRILEKKAREQVRAMPAAAE
jgi:phenylpropionate dioxygenase-like ring-hydroxylating dioxygenase large terminal subunit